MKNSLIKNLQVTSLLLSLSVGGYFISSPQIVKADNSLISSPVITAQKPMKTGKFVTVKQEKQTTGEVRIITENGKRYIELTSDFSTAKGPDVNVILHRQGQIGVNPKESDYFNVASLKSFDGGQRYLIPDYVDLSQFKSVGIWCREFNVTFAFATLS